MMPTIVDSSGVVGEATALPGAPPIAALLGDQQASLVGQGCVRPGDAKITFGTGGMLDLVLGENAPPFDQRGTAGTFPIVAWRHDGRVTWGIEAVMLAAGTNVQWLRDDLGLIASADESDAVAAELCTDTGGVVYVPALLGLGTPAVGLRRARGVLRAHARHRTRGDGARRARRDRAPRRRPRRGGRGRQRHRDSRRCASTAA